MRSANRMGMIMLIILLGTFCLLASCGDDETEEPTHIPTETEESTPGPTDTGELPATPAETDKPPVTPTKTVEPVEDVTITIGNISDLTGPAASAVAIVDYAYQDLITYFNEENLIPGVKLELKTYDGQYDPSKDIPGYLWLRERGADLIVGSLPPTPVSLKPRLDEDQVVMFAMNSADEGIYPPGYSFSLNAPTEAYPQTLLKWIVENDWDWQTRGPAKIGSAGWMGPYEEALQYGMREYAKAHPDQFEWVGGYLTQNSVTWGPEVAALIDCDYVMPPSTAFGMTNFMKEYLEADGKGRFLAADGHPAWLGYAVGALGWENMDGWLFTLSTPWWSDDAEIVDLAYELIDRYHESAETIMWGGNSYLTPFVFWYGALMAIKQTVEDVGPENFSSQALYDTLMTFRLDYEAPQTWGFDETKRTNWDHVGIYVADGAQQDLVRLDPEWQPILYTP